MAGRSGTTTMSLRRLLLLVPCIAAACSQSAVQNHYRFDPPERLRSVCLRPSQSACMIERGQNFAYLDGWLRTMKDESPRCRDWFARAHEELQRGLVYSFEALTDTVGYNVRINGTERFYFDRIKASEIGSGPIVFHEILHAITDFPEDRVTDLTWYCTGVQGH